MRYQYGILCVATSLMASNLLSHSGTTLTRIQDLRLTKEIHVSSAEFLKIASRTTTGGSMQTRGNSPHMITNGNFPNMVTKGNFPNMVTKGNFPNMLTRGNFRELGHAAGKSEIPQPILVATGI